MPLTKKQSAFVEHYLVTWNASAAARRAGYSAKTAGQIGAENLKKLEIQQATRARIAELKMQADEVLLRVAEQARASMGDFLRVGEEEITLTWSLHQIPTDTDGAPDEGAGILDLAMRERVTPTTRVLRTETVRRAAVRLDLFAAQDRLHLIKKYTVDKDGKQTIELYDGQAALFKLGEHHKLWGRGADILKLIDLSKLSDDQLDRLAEGEDPLKVLLG